MNNNNNEFTVDLQPLISIIIPVYNREQLIKETIDSVLWQTYSNWECIVVDDDSTDGTWNVLDGFALKDKRIKIFKRNREPKGASTCRNIGIEKSLGNYLMFLDSDDLLSENCLNYRVSKLCKVSVYDALVFPTGIFSSKIEDCNYQWNKLITVEDDLIRFFNLDMPWDISGPLWNLKDLKRGQWFNEYADSFQDWEMHVNKLAKNLRYDKIDEDGESINTYYRSNSNHFSIGTNFYSENKLKNRVPIFIETIKNVLENATISINLRVAINRFIIRICILLIEKNLIEDAKLLYRLIDIKSKKLFWIYLKTKKQKTIFNKSVEFCLYKFLKLNYLFDSPSSSFMKTKIIDKI
jgi:glycosyltransferase involved in cell wall biosynthesis